MDMFLKNAELEAKHQKFKGRVVLRGDIVQDNSGSYAVFTEQGSSASQMTAAKIMDIISRLPGADTQVKIEDAHKLLKKKSKIGVSRHLDSSTTTQMAWNTVQYGRPVVHLKRNLYGHPLAGLLWERQFEKLLLMYGWEKVSKLGMSLLFIVKKDYSYLCMWMISNWLERNKILIRCGKYSTKKSIWENQHLSWITCTWAALNDNVK